MKTPRRLAPIAALLARIAETSWARAAQSALLGQTPVLAAGTAMFAILATIPTLAAVVSLYGLIADPHSIQSHIAGLDKVLPRAVVEFLGAQLERQADRSSRELGFALAGSTLVALYSARGVIAALMTSLNQAYRVRDKRSAWHKLGISLFFATTTMIGLLVFAAVIVALPALVAVLPINSGVLQIANSLRWPCMFVAVIIGQATLFKLVPAPRQGKAHVVWPGAFVGTSLWVAASWLLSQWVERVADYQLFYGSFGTVVVVLLWFYCSVMVIIVGGFLNAELERREGNAPASESFFQ
jgi:membrane protein